MTDRTIPLWILSAIGGGFVVFGVLSFGVRGLVVLAVLLLAATRTPTPRTTVGGALFGFGAVGALALSQSASPALVIALATMLAGAILTLVPILARSRTANS